VPAVPARSGCAAAQCSRPPAGAQPATGTHSTQYQQSFSSVQGETGAKMAHELPVDRPSPATTQFTRCMRIPRRVAYLHCKHDSVLPIPSQENSACHKPTRKAGTPPPSYSSPMASQANILHCYTTPSLD
jgi:hypothetical protein